MSISFNQVRIGVVWSMIQNWGLRVGTLLVFMLLARILSPQEMGLFAAANTVIAFCALFVDAGLREAVVQAPQISRKQLSSVFIINLMVAVLLVAGLWVGASWVTGFFRLPEMVWILRISSLSVVLSSLCFVQMAMMRRAFEYKRLATITLGATFVAGALTIAMALNGWGVWSLVAQVVVTAAYSAVLMWWRPQWQVGWEFDWGAVRGLCHYGFQRLLTALLDFANTRFIELFFASVFGAAMLGLYVVGARIYQALMQILCSAILDIAHSAFSRLTSDLARMREAYYTAFELTAAIIMPAFMLLAAVAPELNLTLFGAKWVGAENVLLPLLVLGGIQALEFFNGVLYNALGRPGIGLAFVAGKSVVTMAVLFMARDLSFEEVLWAYFISQLIVTPVSFAVAKRVSGISYSRVCDAVWPFALGAVAAAGCVTLLRDALPQGLPAWERLVALSAAGGFFYVAAIGLMARRRVVKLVGVLRHRRQAPAV